MGALGASVGPEVMKVAASNNGRGDHPAWFTVNGSGCKESWISRKGEESTSWIQYDLDREYYLLGLHV